MADIKQVVDGDTLDTTDGDRLRVGYIDTPESVHPDSKRNTPEGKIASDFAKAVLPEGKEVTSETYTTGKYGRNISGVTRNINGVNVDYGLVALDQEMATYYTNYGEHVDPLQHARYKEYYSNKIPYQFGSAEEPLTEDEYKSMSEKHTKFTEDFGKFKAGELSQEEFDKTTADLYGNPDMVARYRNQLKNWNKPIEDEAANSLILAMRTAFKENPEWKEQYNRVVRNGHLMSEPVPEKESSFWKDAALPFKMFGSVANLMDTDLLWNKRTYGSNFDVPEGELTKGLPDKYKSLVLQEATDNNTESALIMRDQLIEDVANQRDFDDMPIYAQFGYSIPAVLADPLTLVPAGSLLRAGKGVVNANKAWQMSRVIAGKGAISGSNTMAKLAAWTGVGATEGAIFNLPRLNADHTYTSKDYMVDVVMDAGFGFALGGIVQGGAKALDYTKAVKEARRKEQDALANHVEQEAKRKAEGKPTGDVVFKEKAQKVNKSLNKAIQEVQPNLSKKSDEPKKVVPLQAVTKVSKEGFRTAVNTMKKAYGDSPITKLLNSQLGLNKKILPDDARDVADRLNADLVHIMAAFPDGRIPDDIQKSIAEITFRQKSYNRNNALQDVLTGVTTNPTQTLTKYVDYLRKQDDLWEGYAVQPLTTQEFFDQNLDFLALEQKVSDEDVLHLNRSVPRELSLLKDAVELNRMAQKSDDADMIKAVEELNGMIVTRMEQKELGGFKEKVDAKDYFQEYVKLAPQEIVAKLKAEGLKAGTPDYKARFKALRNERVPVDKEVREVGRLDSRKNNIMEEFDRENPDAVRQVEERVDPEFTKDLLPRQFLETSTESAYKNPTKASLENLRKKLNSKIIKPLGLKNLDRYDSFKTERRIAAVKQAILNNPKQTIMQRVVNAGQWQNVEDVIRASATLAEEAKAKRNAVKPTGEKAKPAKSDDKGKQDVLDKLATVKPVLTEELLEKVSEGNLGKVIPKISNEEFKAAKDATTDAWDKIVDDTVQKVDSAITKFITSGERTAWEVAKRPTGALDYVGRLSSSITQDLATKFQNSEIQSLEFVGYNVTELGKGFGGNIQRKASGGVIRDAIFKESAMQIVPQYVRIMDDYAAAHGKKAIGKLMAQQMSGAESSLVNKFNREVFTVQELRRQGKEVPSGINKSVVEFVDQWDKYMDYNFNQLIDNKIGGFSKNRKIKNYIPHIWKPNNLNAAIKKHGEDKVIRLLTEAYNRTPNNSVVDTFDAGEMAKRQVKWIKEQGKLIDQGRGGEVDQYMPVADSRGKQRLDLDTTTEVEGLSVMDLLDTDVIGLGVKYSNRVGGWVGLSKSTNGLLTNELTIKTLKNHIIEEGKSKGIPTETYEQYYDDLMNIMMGRPTRGGLVNEARQLKDLTALTRMGGLGTAQLIETGAVITRSVLNLFSSEPVVRKVMKLAKATDAESRQFMDEIQSISNVTDDLEWLERQSVHLDQEELTKVSKARQLSMSMVDFATWGKLKAPASRLLGKTTGYNMIRKFQSRTVQASFVMDVAKHFKDGTGKMGNARMADVGLTDTQGVNKELKEVFDNIVEWDDKGLPSKLNVDKWPIKAREQFQFAMIRDEAQNIQRTLVGELPPWMNRPMVALGMQFREMPIVAQNKQLGRSMAFADKEAVTMVMLNAAFSGLVRYGKFVGLGVGAAALTGNEAQAPNEEQMQVSKYIAQFGLFPDLNDLATTAYKAGTTGDKDEVGKLMNQVPVMGLMDDYRKTLPVYKDYKDNAEAAQGLVPLGNTVYGDLMHTWLMENFNGSD